jgi:cytochrome c55X
MGLFKRRFFQVFSVVSVLPFLIFSISGSADDSFSPSDKRQQELGVLVIQDCGSCHGMTLKGGLGPALTKEALDGKPDAMLIDTILQGRMGSAMPPWSGFLNKNEATWIVKKLKEGSMQ